VQEAVVCMRVDFGLPARSL